MNPVSATLVLMLAVRASAAAVGGDQVLVRVNDRGPALRGRVIALTPRAIALLGGGNASVLRVRVQVQETESRQLVAALAGADDH